MSKIIYHKGTGTYFGLDDGVLVLDIDQHPEAITEWEDDEVERACDLYGSEFNNTYVHVGEAVVVNPHAIRSEAAAFIDVFGDAMPEEELAPFRWALAQPDEVLDVIGNDVLNSDDLWQNFVEEVRYAIRETWIISQEEE